MMKDPEQTIGNLVDKSRIWQEGDTLYYKGGVTDPDYCVLKFTAIRGRYYNHFHSEDFEKSYTVG